MSNEHGDHADHVREEHELHEAHEREERALHSAHERVEDELHAEHEREEEKLHKAHEHEEEEERESKVEVTYNGLTKALEVDLDAPASVALEAALNLFSITQNRHVMALYTIAGTELQDTRSLKDQGVKKCDLLALRQSTVKGGDR